MAVTGLAGMLLAATGLIVGAVDAKNHAERVAGTPQAAAPGSVVDFQVTGTLAAGERWRSTSWQVGSAAQTCADTTDHTGAGTFSEFRRATVPETGAIQMTARLYSDATCGVLIGTATGSVASQAPASNPDLARGCDQRVALVLDESYSIAQASGGVTAVRTGATAFVNGLVDSGAEVAVVEFNSQARTVPLGGSIYNAVTASYVAGPFATYAKGGATPPETYDPARYSSPNYYTNWQDAVVHVAALPQRPDMVVFLTDGDPTARNTAAAPGFETGFPVGSYGALQPAVAGADALRLAGAHVFVVGVGQGLADADSQIRLRSISGPNLFAGDIFTADYTLVTDFSKLQASLAELGRQVCAVRVNVSKRVDETGAGDFRLANGWDFGGAVTVTPGAVDGFRWLLPGDEVGPPSGGSTRTGTTASTISAGDGVTAFAWRPGRDTRSRIVVTDKGKPGYHFDSVSCTRNGAPLTVPNAATVPIDGLALGDVVSCAFRDQRDLARLKVVKHFPAGRTLVSLLLDGQEKARGSAAEFDTGFVTVPIGVHQVSEEFAVPAASALFGSRYACTDGDRTVAAGVGTLVAGGISLATGDEVTCTFTNTKTLALEVDKAADPQVVDEPGGPVRFDVTVVNTSDVGATVTRLSDDRYGNLDADSDAGSHSWISSSCLVGAQLEAFDGAAGGADTYRCSFVGDVRGDAGSSHRDVFTAELTDPLGDTVERSAPAVVNVRATVPGIDVDKTAAPTLLLGSGLVTYSVVVTNTSNAGPLDVDQLRDSIYGDLLRGTVRAVCSYGSDTVRFPFRLPSGESLLCSFEVTVSTSGLDTVTASGVDLEGRRVTDSANALVTVVQPLPPEPLPPTPTPTPPTPPPPAPPTPPEPAPIPLARPLVALSVKKSAPAEVQADAAGRATLRYDLAVRNGGPDTAPQVTLHDQAPAGVHFTRIARQPSQGRCTITRSGKELSCSLGDLVAVQSVSVTVEAAISGGPSSVRNTVTAACTTSPAVPCSASASVVSRVARALVPPPLVRHRTPPPVTG